MTWVEFRDELFHSVCSYHSATNRPVFVASSKAKQLVLDMIASAKEKKKKRVAELDQAEKEKAVLEKLEGLGFAQGNLSQRLKAFISGQPLYMISQQEWPKGVEAQVSFLFANLDREFEKRGEFKRNEKM